MAAVAVAVGVFRDLSEKSTLTKHLPSPLFPVLGFFKLVGEGGFSRHRSACLRAYLALNLEYTYELQRSFFQRSFFCRVGTLLPWLAGQAGSGTFQI